MKIPVTDRRKYIALYLLIALLLCAALSLLMLVGAKVSGRDSAPDAGTETESESESEAMASPVIIIDAGHGGEDGGTVGKNGVYEKDLNLSISLLLAEILREDGFSVVLTRSEDILLYDRNSDYQGQKKVQDLATRRRIAESYEDAVFVSIHMNAFPEEKYSGLQVYYSENDEGSKILAEGIQTLTREQLMPDNTRKCKAAGESIYLLDRLVCPAVLVECGFLSNPDECARLSTPEYQRELASTIANAMEEYINSSKKALPTP